MTTEQLYDIYLKHPVVTTDSRKTPSGSIFFALKGDRFDGNRYAATALANGCAYAVVDDANCVIEGDERYLLVNDVLITLQQLAHHHRKTLQTPVIGITGTNGKTTTKELTAAVLSKKYNVLYTQGNLNNHIGVPLTLLRLSPDHDIAIIEMGANHPGEIHTLAAIADPDCGIITNVGMAHLEGFGSIEGVLQTKGALYDNLRTRGDNALVFLHADDERLKSIIGSLPTYTYGINEATGPDILGQVSGQSPYLSFRWRTATGAWHEINTHLIGDYNIYNALAAIAEGSHYGVDESDICDAISKYVPTNNRSQWVETGSNCLIVDTYNANPTSMNAALDNFARVASPHRMVILGEMGELGDASHEAHQHIVDRLKDMHLDDVWLVGEAFGRCNHGFRVFRDVDEVKAILAEHPLKDKTIFIKGSNSMRLFELPDLL